MRIKYFVLLFIVALAALSSCKNNDNFSKPLVVSYLNVVNASADTLNFYLNGTRQNNSSSLYPGGQSFYLKVAAGLQNYQFKKAGAPNALFNLPLSLIDSTNYSLYIYGETVDNTFFTRDTLSADTGKNRFQVRFVNASPDAGSLNVFVGDTLNFKTRTFKSSSVFLHGGIGIKRVRIYQTGSAIAKIDTPITFQEGRIYTLFSKGLLNGKGNSIFNVRIALNH